MEEEQETTVEEQPHWIANFWRRIGALIIDTVILGFIGYLLGLAFESVFVTLAGWGRMVGFSVALIYFGLMNSQIFDGQTIGKKLLNIRVVDKRNQTISIGKSALRYTVLATPFTLNGAQINNELLLSILMYPLSLIIFGGMAAIGYMYVFNRVTRQSLHDIVVDTYVVNADAEQQEPGTVWRTHFIVVVVLCALAILAPVVTNQWVDDAPFKDMLAVQSALTAEEGITFASVSVGESTFSSNQQETMTTTYVRTQAFLVTNNVTDAEYARHLATIVVANYPDVTTKDTLTITLTYGYDIGIWSNWLGYYYNFDPKEIAGTE